MIIFADLNAQKERKSMDKFVKIFVILMIQTISMKMKTDIVLKIVQIQKQGLSIIMMGNLNV